MATGHCKYAVNRAGDHLRGTLCFSKLMGNRPSEARWCFLGDRTVSTPPRLRTWRGRHGAQRPLEPCQLSCCCLKFVLDPLILIVLLSLFSLLSSLFSLVSSLFPPRASFSNRTSHLSLRTLHQAIESAPNCRAPLRHPPWPGGMREAMK